MSNLSIKDVKFSTSLSYNGVIAKKGYVFYIATTVSGKKVWRYGLMINRQGVTGEDEPKYIEAFKISFLKGIEKQLQTVKEKSHAAVN